MALTPISHIRRRELMKAALEVLETQGVAGATLEKVAEKAGASKGIVLHYFKNKQQLFEAAMRYGNAELRDDVVRRMRNAKTPADRLWAIIAGNFSQQFFRPELCQTWLALCAEVPRDPQFRRLQTVIHARMHSNLVTALKHLMPIDEVPEFALALSALIDGLWLRMAINASSMSRDVALRILLTTIRERIPSFDADTEAAP